MNFGVGHGTRSGLGRGVAAVALAAVAVVGGAGAASALTVEGAGTAVTAQGGAATDAGQRPGADTQAQGKDQAQESPAKWVAGDSRWLVFNETGSDISLYDSSKWTTGNYYWTLPSGWTHAGQDSQWGTDLTTWIKFGDGTKVDMEFENAAMGWPSATVDGDSHNYSALERKTYAIKGHTIEIMRNVDTADGAKDFYVYVKS